MRLLRGRGASWLCFARAVADVPLADRQDGADAPRPLRYTGVTRVRTFTDGTHEGDVAGRRAIHR